MKEINAYLVPRFSPEQCPKCSSRFKGPYDFRPVAVAESTESAKPAEGTSVSEMLLTAWNGETLIQYLRCQHCQNITMIVNLDQSYVLTLPEAEDLIREGYTAILPVTIQQIDTELNEPLSFWFRVTYDRLHKQAETLRVNLNSLEDHGKRASRFEKGMNPILSDVLREIKKQEKLERLHCAAREALEDNWERIGSDSREMLTAANLIRNDLMLYAQVKPELDFVAPVLFYARALENELYTKVFKPFAEVSNTFNYEYEASNPFLKEAIWSLKQMCERGRKPNLGEMAHCLNTLTTPKVYGNWFRTFIKTHIRDYECLFVEQVFPQRMVGFINAYRNRWGIIGPLTRQECEKCEEYLFCEPVKLLKLVSDLV